MKEWILILTGLFSLTAWGVTPKDAVYPKDASGKVETGPGIAKEVEKGHSLVHTIHLDDYLKEIKPEQVVDKMDSQGKSNFDIWVIFNKKDDGTRQLAMQLFDLNRDG